MKYFEYYIEMTVANPKQKDKKKIADLIFALKTNLNDLQVAVVDNDFDNDSAFFDDAVADLETAHEAIEKLMGYIN